MESDPTVEAFSSFLSVVPVIDRLMAETRAPRAAEELLDLVAPLGVGPGSVVIDAGSYEGDWAARLAERFGCKVVALDIVHSAVVAADEQGIPAVTGDVQRLPFAGAVADLVWCRDMLSCVADPQAVLLEFFRVLVPSGRVLLYVAFPTAELEPREASRLFTALDAPDWWRGGRAPLDEAISAAGFRVTREDPVSPEHQERALLDQGDIGRELAVLGRLERERARFEAEMGSIWYERWRAWMAWAPYLILGKLKTVAWTLEKP